MTFDALKAAIIVCVRYAEICPAWQALATATNQEELIAAAMGRIEWSYGVIGDELLAEFNGELLQLSGIYTGNKTITNPTAETLYFLSAGNSTLTLSELSRASVVVMGGHNLAISLSGYAFCNLKTWGTGTVSVTVGGSAFLCSEAAQSSGQNITNNGTAEIRLTDNSTATYSGTGSAIVRMYNAATLTATGPADIRTFGNNTTVNQSQT